MSLYRCIFSCVLLLFFSTCNFAQSLDCHQSHCVAVVDAGSTGSRLHVYSYDLSSTNTPIHISEKWSKKIKPGFSSIQANEETISAYLTTLFSGAPEYSMGVYFYATGGMRLLSHPQQQQHYNCLKNWFDDQSKWYLIDSRTITGTEEGLFDWLAVNYQLGTLESANKKQVGVMDMGGASVQIVFPVPNSIGLSSDVKEVSLYGHKFRLFIHSFLGLGQTEITHQFLNTNACFSDDYKLPDGLSANGDAYSCEKIVSPLINKVHHVREVVHPMMELSSVSNWYALGGIDNLVKSKIFIFPDTRFTNEELLAQADSAVCRQQWANLQHLYPNNDYLYGYCLFPSYFYALIVEGYGLDADKYIYLMDNNDASDWTMGVVLGQKFKKAS